METAFERGKKENLEHLRKVKCDPLAKQSGAAWARDAGATKF
jgi:hypothetical protein